MVLKVLIYLVAVKTKCTNMLITVHPIKVIAHHNRCNYNQYKL